MKHILPLPPKSQSLYTYYTQHKLLSVHFLKTDHRFPDYFLEQETFVTSAQNVNQKQRLLTNWSSCSAGLILFATSQKLNQFMDLTFWAEVPNGRTVAQPIWLCFTYTVHHSPGLIRLHLEGHAGLRHVSNIWYDWSSCQPTGRARGSITGWLREKRRGTWGGFCSGWKLSFANFFLFGCWYKINKAVYDQHIRSSPRFSILPKDTLTCRPGKSNQRPSDNKTLALALGHKHFLFYKIIWNVFPWKHHIMWNN